MFGFRYVKFPPTVYVIKYRNGQIVRQGAGLSFFYFTPNSILVSVRMASADVPFIFNEVTADFQDVAIQGELTYRVKDPKALTTILDFSHDAIGRYRSDDPDRLNERLIHAAQILARSFTQRHSMRDLLVKSDELVTEMVAGLRASPAVELLGVEVLGLSILSIKASPEMSKALQAEARENLLRKADEAVFLRRNAAVELERQIKENELNTEIAVEHKKREVRETQMQADISVEQQRADLVDRRVENEKKEADSRSYALSTSIEPLKGVDWRTLMAASAGGINPKLFVAMAFRDLAENAEKIGNLNISPDLLETLLSTKEKA